MWSVLGQFSNFYFFLRICPDAPLPLAMCKQCIRYNALCCDTFRPVFEDSVSCIHRLYHHHHHQHVPEGLGVFPVP